MLSQVMEKVVDEVFEFIEEQCSDDVPLYRHPAPMPAAMGGGGGGGSSHRAVLGEDVIMSEDSNSSPEQKRGIQSRPGTPGKGRADAIRDPAAIVTGGSASRGVSPRGQI